MSNKDDHIEKYIVRNFQTSVFPRTLFLLLKNNLILLHKTQLLSGGLLCVLIREHILLQIFNLLSARLLFLNTSALVS